MQTNWIIFRKYFYRLTHNNEKENIEQFIKLFTNHADKVMTNNTFIYENVPFKTLKLFLKILAVAIFVFFFFIYVV